MQNEYRWYLAAADGGHPYAMLRLSRGKYVACELFKDCKQGLEQWREKAIDIWERRANENDGDAMFELAFHGHNWLTRLPLINNWVGSRRLKKAMEMGSTDAIIEFSYHTKDGSKEMKQEAIMWLKKA